LDDRGRMAAMEVLRRFVRYASDGEARRAIQHFGTELGDKTQLQLEATYVIRTFMGGADILTYAEYVKETQQLLHDTLQAYEDAKNAPTVGALMNDMDSLTGGLTDNDRRKIADDALALGEAIATLAEQHKALKGAREATPIGQLLNGKLEPKSALDILRVMGGYLAKGHRATVELFKMPHLHPLTERAASKVKSDLQIGNTVLRGAMRAIPPNRPMRLTQAHIHAEVESLWGEISLHQQRQIVEDLSKNLQKIADLCAMIADKGGREALQENSGLGKSIDSLRNRPRNTFEFYRFLAAYFRSRIKS
jgi:hypothetical protein